MNREQFYELSKNLNISVLLDKFENINYTVLFIKLGRAYLKPLVTSEEITDKRISSDPFIPYLVVKAVNKNDIVLKSVLETFINREIMDFNLLIKFIEIKNSDTITRLVDFLNVYYRLSSFMSKTKREYFLFELLGFCPKMLEDEYTMEVFRKQGSAIISSCNAMIGILDTRMFKLLSKSEGIQSKDVNFFKYIASMIHYLEKQDKIKKKKTGEIYVNDYNVLPFTTDIFNFYFTEGFVLIKGGNLNYNSICVNLELLVKLSNVIDFKEDVESAILFDSNLLYITLKNTDSCLVISLYKIFDRKVAGKVK